MNRTPSPSDRDPWNGQPITEWMQGYQRGDDLKQHDLWKAVSGIILNYAHKQLKTRPTIDGADGIANEAFYQLLKGLRADTFNHLKNRHDLLIILLELCKRRATDSKRRGSAKKRGEGKVLSGGHFDEADQYARVPGRKMQPDEEIIVEESFHELVELVFKRYRDRPEIEIFECAYIEGMSDAEIFRKELKDQSGKRLGIGLIRRRRIEMLEFLKRQECEEE